MMLPIGSVIRASDDEESDDSETSSDDDDESDESEEDGVPKHPAAKHYGWVCTVFISKKAAPKPVLQRCWRDGSSMEYRAVGGKNTTNLPHLTSGTFL